MKVRSGFVSNSSSSSFLIWGAFIGKSELHDLLPEADSRNLYDALDEKLSDGLEHHSPDGCDGFFIGVSWDKVGDDETGAQFKSRVQKLLAASFGKEIQCGTLEEAWRDG